MSSYSKKRKTNITLSEAQKVEFSRISNAPVYGADEMTCCAPKNFLPMHSSAPYIAKQMIEDELALDGNPMLNMASFVTTFMEKVSYFKY